MFDVCLVETPCERCEQEEIGSGEENGQRAWSAQESEHEVLVSGLFLASVQGSWFAWDLANGLWAWVLDSSHDEQSEREKIVEVIACPHGAVWVIAAEQCHGWSLMNRA